jgi:ubiquinol-cytochrome c reductase iron-sulfur subunit
MDFRANRLPIGHADRKPWVYFMTAGTGFVLASLVRVIAMKLVHTGWPAKDVFAAGMVEVDLRQIREGQNFTAKWRGKPVFIRKRTQEMIDASRADDPIIASMREPATDAERCQKPEWLICLGICTHLGCIPQPDQGKWGGYFCPCHGSHYDHSGRIRQGPAPKNLELIPTTFLDEHTVKLG